MLDQYLPFGLRLFLGLAFFTILGVIDYKKNPTNPRRAKEYFFIASLAALATIFGVLHDSVTYSLSKEYFIYGKQLGPNLTFFPDVAWLAIKASYWIGILVGVAYVVANNPRKTALQISYKQLFTKIIWPFCGAILFATVGAFVSQMAYPYFTQDSDGILLDPKAFEMVAFIHWGTYIGGAIGTVIGVFLILKERKLFVNKNQNNFKRI